MTSGLASPGISVEYVIADRRCKQEGVLLNKADGFSQRFQRVVLQWMAIVEDLPSWFMKAGNQLNWGALATALGTNDSIVFQAESPGKYL